MPVKTGIQTVKEVKEIYRVLSENNKHVNEPSYIFLSAHVANLGF